jgi:hypothetical protein
MRLIVILTLAIPVAPLIIDAQQVRGLPRIGIISALSAAAGVQNVDAFREDLRLLGYIEGQNVAIETHFIGG